MPLEMFEGKPVVGALMIVKGLEGGLTDAMAIDPQKYHHGQRVIIVSEVEIREVGYKPADVAEPDGDQLRKHIGKATTVDVLTMDDELGVGVGQHLVDVRDRVKTKRERDGGTFQLPSEDVMRKEHEANEHAFLTVEGCPLCEAETTGASDGATEEA